MEEIGFLLGDISCLSFSTTKSARSACNYSDPSSFLYREVIYASFVVNCIKTCADVIDRGNYVNFSKGKSGEILLISTTRMDKYIIFNFYTEI